MFWIKPSVHYVPSTKHQTDTFSYYPVKRVEQPLHSAHTSDTVGDVIQNVVKSGGAEVHVNFCEKNIFSMMRFYQNIGPTLLALHITHLLAGKCHLLANITCSIKNITKLSLVIYKKKFQYDCSNLNDCIEMPKTPTK